MKIIITERPSIDGIGIIMWRIGWLAGGSQIVRMYRRPSDYMPTGAKLWLMTICTRSGELVESREYSQRRHLLARVARVFCCDRVQLAESAPC